MDVILNKYINFKKFVSDNAPPNNTFVLQLQDLPFEIFIKLIKQKSKDITDKEQCLKEILIYANINISDISTSNLEKFLLYIEYFIEISKYLV